VADDRHRNRLFVVGSGGLSLFNVNVEGRDDLNGLHVGQVDDA
jgi:hypothetical protein